MDLRADLYVSGQCRDWVQPYRQDVPEIGTPVELVVNGTLPMSICGSYFRNGPGKFSVGGTRVAHPFDGDGVICKLHFTAPKRATFLVQYVKTDEYGTALMPFQENMSC